MCLEHVLVQLPSRCLLEKRWQLFRGFPSECRVRVPIVGKIMKSQGVESPGILLMIRKNDMSLSCKTVVITWNTNEMKQKENAKKMECSSCIDEYSEGKYLVSGHEPNKHYRKM